MTLQEIQSKVIEQASARLSQVIGRAFVALRYRHVHEAWRKDCCCEYCVFINSDYVKAKLALHQIKKVVRKLEWYDTDTEVHHMDKLYDQEELQRLKCWELKQEKKKLRDQPTGFDEIDGNRSQGI